MPVNGAPALSTRGLGKRFGDRPAFRDVSFRDRALGLRFPRPERLCVQKTSSTSCGQAIFGRRGCRRCRLASWWRRIRISAVFHVSSRRDSRSHAATRVIRRKANRRHMIGDHHSRATGRVTPLVRAVDGILGTHTVEIGTTAFIVWYAWIWPKAAAAT